MKVQICSGKSCSDKYSKYIEKRIHNDISFYSWKDIELETTLCMGSCKKSPNIKIDGEVYNYMNPSKASELICGKIKEQKKKEKSNTHLSKTKKK